MSMTAINVIADMLFAKGYRVIIDQTVSGYITFGYAPSGSLKTEAKWTLMRLKITDSNKVNDFEWGGREGITICNKVWNTLGGTTYNGATDIFQAD